MTQRYAHHYPESLREGVEILERYRLASTNSPSGRAGTRDYWCKLLKNLVGRVGVKPTACWLRDALLPKLSRPRSMYLSRKTRNRSNRDRAGWAWVGVFR